MSGRTAKLVRKTAEVSRRKMAAYLRTHYFMTLDAKPLQAGWAARELASLCRKYPHVNWGKEDRNG